MKISASIYSNNGIAPEDLVQQLDEHNIDFIHIDCRDETSVFDDISRIRQHSETPIDLHLITNEPEQYYEAAAQLGIEYLTLQHEALEAYPSLVFPEGWQPKLGIAITSDTPIAVFEQYAADFDFILFMTTVPGESGGTFNKLNFGKIRAFRRQFRDKRIHVDGGVNAEISFILRNMGVYAAVSGSYLLKGQTIGAKLIQLKHNDTQSGYQVADFMMGREEIPIIRDSNDLQLSDLLQSIENYRMGFTILEDDEGGLAGICSNADIRKGLLKNVADLNKTSANDVINRTPICAQTSQTVAELLEMIKATRIPIGYLPVVNDENKLMGALKFNNLIKGEL